MPSEQQPTYSGPVEIWADEAKRTDAIVTLRASTIITPVHTLGEPSPMTAVGTTSWSGHVSGPDNLDIRSLQPFELELRFPSGRVGKAVIDGNGRLTGLGVIPFD